MYNLISIFIGTALSIILMINGTLCSNMGNYSSTVIIHTVGIFTIIAVLIINKSKFKLYKGIPLYLYSAGAIGVFTVLFNNLSFNYLGASLTIALGLFGQSVTSILIDHFGLLRMKKIEFQKKKIIGLVIILLGIVVMTIF